MRSSPQKSSVCWCVSSSRRWWSPVTVCVCVFPLRPPVAFGYIACRRERCHPSVWYPHRSALQRLTSLWPCIHISWHNKTPFTFIITTAQEDYVQQTAITRGFTQSRAERERYWSTHINGYFSVVLQQMLEEPVRINPSLKWNSSNGSSVQVLIQMSLDSLTASPQT